MNRPAIPFNGLGTNRADALSPVQADRSVDTPAESKRWAVTGECDVCGAENVDLTFTVAFGIDTYHCANGCAS